MSRASLLTCLALGALAIAPAASGQDRSADWLKKPTERDLYGVWPSKALDRGLGGKATIECVVTLQGTLRACKVLSEEPAGAGFGAAALALSPQFLMRPEMKSGQAVESTVRIPINFHKPDRELGSWLTPVTESALPGDKVYSNLLYREAPTVADVAAAYPPKARAQKKGGAVTLDCKIGEGGRLGGCAEVREEPRGFGFTGAARTLARKFVAPTDDGRGNSLVGARALLLVAF